MPKINFIFYHRNSSIKTVSNLSDVLIHCDDDDDCLFDKSIILIPTSVYEYIVDHPDMDDFEFVLQVHCVR